MKIHIELTEDDLKKLVYEHIQHVVGLGVDISLKDIQIQVKSTQNYKSEWEKAEFRAIYERISM